MQIFLWAEKEKDEDEMEEEKPSENSKKAKVEVVDEDERKPGKKKKIKVKGDNPIWYCFGSANAMCLCLWCRLGAAERDETDLDASAGQNLKSR